MNFKDFTKERLRRMNEAVRNTRIGMRNIKTAFAVMLCAILYFCLDRNPTFACIGAVFGMDNTVPTSLKTGGNRLIGTVIGGTLGMGFFAISRLFSFRSIPTLILLFLGIMLLIYLSQILSFAGAIQAGAVVFCIVMLNTPEDQYISYALNRMIDTMVGVVISVGINVAHLKSSDGGEKE